MCLYTDRFEVFANDSQIAGGGVELNGSRGVEGSGMGLETLPETNTPIIMHGMGKAAGGLQAGCWAGPPSPAPVPFALRKALNGSDGVGKRLVVSLNNVGWGAWERPRAWGSALMGRGVVGTWCQVRDRGVMAATGGLGEGPRSVAGRARGAHFANKTWVKQMYPTRMSQPREENKQTKQEF